MSGSRNLTRFTFIDLFAGIGGNRIAFEKAGGKCVFSQEKDPVARAVYFENFGETPADDLNDVPESMIPEHDVLVACLPSVSFSLAGRRGLHDTAENDPFHKLGKIIAAKRPKAFLFQGMPVLKRAQREGNQHQGLITRLRILGYHIHEGVLDASLVRPFNQRRLFAVGLQSDAPFSFKVAPVLPPKLGAILDREADERYTLTDKEWVRMRESQSREIKGGKRFSGMGYELVDPDSVLRTSISPRTIMRILVPQGEGRNPRRLTPTECKRLMGYPEDFKIPASDGDAYKFLIGSVTVPFVERIAGNIIETLFPPIDQPALDRNDFTPMEPWKALEIRAASWLKEEYSYKIRIQDRVSGHVEGSLYKPDVRACKKRIFGRVNVWVECKRLKTSVKGDDILKLVYQAKEVRDGGRWNPCILMLVAEGDFDIGAERLAEKYGVYLVKAENQDFDFIGKMTKEDFNNMKESNY